MHGPIQSSSELIGNNSKIKYLILSTSGTAHNNILFQIFDVQLVANQSKRTREQLLLLEFDLNLLNLYIYM